MQENIIYISRKSDRYPMRFEALPHMPDGIYVKGDIPDDDIPSVAIVGARMCSRYGRNTAFLFGKKLAERGVQVISGMALGIDGAAQEGALSGGGRTFAVLGCGVDICYPRSNHSLYEQIPNHGGILSELSPGTQPYAYNFPMRNRLISALADIVVVVEARKKSGSLITVDYALEQGKSVYAVPGRVGDALSDGCNYLIAQGAGIAWSVEALVEELMMQHSLSNAARASRAEAARKMRQEVQNRISEAEEAEGRKKDTGEHFEKCVEYVNNLPEGEDSASVKGRILLSLGRDEKTPDELAGELGLAVPELNAALGELLLSGYIEEVGRSRYVRTADS